MGVNISAKSNLRPSDINSYFLLFCAESWETALVSSAEVSVSGICDRLYKVVGPKLIFDFCCTQCDQCSCPCRPKPDFKVDPTSTERVYYWLRLARIYQVLECELVEIEESALPARLCIFPVAPRQRRWYRALTVLDGKTAILLWRSSVACCWFVVWSRHWEAQGPSFGSAFIEDRSARDQRWLFPMLSKWKVEGGGGGGRTQTL